MVNLLLATGAGYLLGSIPMGVLLAKAFGWPDPRTRGSGHTGARNTARGGGIKALALTLLADLGKGVAAVWVAGIMSDNPWAVTAAGIMAVAGHNWPVWLGFKGGMGLSTTGGVLLQPEPLSVILSGLCWLIVRRIIKHTARTTVIASPSIPITLWLLGADPPILAMGTGCAALFAIRTGIVDWNRESRDDAIPMQASEETA